MDIGATFQATRQYVADLTGVVHVVHALQTFRKLIPYNVDDVYTTLVEHPSLDSLASYQAVMTE